MEASRRSELLCERTRQYASLEVDDELSEFERGFLAAHLRQCGDCRLYRSEIHALAERIRTAPPEVPSFEVRVPVPVSSRSTSRLARLQLGAAAALVIGVVGTASLLPANVDREPVTPDGQETLEFPFEGTNVFSRGLQEHGRSTGSSAPNDAGLNFAI